MWIGIGHDFTNAMQPSALGHVIEYGFEQSSARPELIIDGQPRHAGSLGNPLERDATTRAERRARRLE
jgi:hypothetical protein